MVISRTSILFKLNKGGIEIQIRNFRHDEMLIIDHAICSHELKIKARIGNGCPTADVMGLDCDLALMTSDLVTKDKLEDFESENQKLNVRTLT
jgi:hypothetical protein